MSDPADARPLSLTNPALDSATGRFAVPKYDRRRVWPAIIHPEAGGFNRAHQAVYTDEALAAGDLGWGIRGASECVEPKRSVARKAPMS